MKVLTVYAHTYGFAFGLTADGWRGDIHGRIPLLHHQRAPVRPSTATAEGSTP